MAKGGDWLEKFLGRHGTKLLLLILVFSALLRLALLSTNPDVCPRCGDISNYVAKAKTLAGLNLNFFDARYDEGTYAPFFEFALAIFIRLFGEGSLPYVAPLFGVLLVAATYFLGTRLFGEAAGVLSALFVSVHPLLTVFSLVPLVESLFAFLLVVAFAFFYRSKFLTAGVFLGMAYLTKYNGILAIISVATYLVVSKKYRILLPLVLGILLVTSPWLLRNYLMFGDPFHSSDVPRFFGAVSMASERPAGPLLYLAGLPIYIGSHFTLLSLLGLALSLGSFRKFLPVFFTIAAFFIFFSLWPTMEFRHMISIVPFITVFAASGFLGLSRLLAGAVPKRYQRDAKTILVVLLALIVLENLTATYAFTKALDAFVSIGKLLKG